jgi:Big-like domain-containing protein/SdrD B-like protein
VTHPRAWFQLLLLLATVGLVVASPVALGGKGKGSGGGSCPRRTCDTRPPVVSIADPTTGESIGGVAQVTGSAADNGEIAEIVVRVDAADPRPADGSATWSATLDTTAYPDGSHLITVTATDQAGNVGAASVTVVVSNEPSPPSAPPPPPPGEQPPPPPPPEPPPTQTPVVPPTLAPGTVGGFVFSEADRDGVFETDEQPLANRHLFLFSGAGTYLTNTYSDASGWYSFGGLADADYRVEFAPAAWWAIREDWVPDTTGSLRPTREVHLVRTARADLGWRPIVRSTDAAAPITTYVGPSGLDVRSYDDVVSARQVHDRLVSGELVGSEARFVTVRFDFTKAGSTSTVATGSNGVYTEYHATSNVTFLSWLEGDDELFHEYGHAWSLYYAYIVQQDPSLSAYHEARGLVGDARIDSSYSWSAKEMIAEDYRQLFGTASARASTQLNRDVPPAADVVGLEAFLRTAFQQSPEP